MNSRERVMAALNHKVPDMVPIDLGDNCTEVPPENIVVMFDAIKENRKYS